MTRWGQTIACPRSGNADATNAARKSTDSGAIPQACREAPRLPHGRIAPTQSGTAQRQMIVGAISDTHGLLRPEALAALTGSELIVHAGDIGTPAILDALRALAPVIAIRGNNDTGAWARDLPDTIVAEAGSARLLLIHDRKDLAIDPAAEGYAAVISGHSHQPAIETLGGVLYLNPGSAGRRRFRLPISVARLRIDGSKLDPELLLLG